MKRQKFPLTDEELIDSIKGYMYLMCITCGYNPTQFLNHIAHLLELYEGKEKTSDFLKSLQRE